MAHWTSHAFHATVMSPRMMYEDVTVGFSDGSVIFTGRPLRNWRAWSWITLVVRFVVLAGGVVALATTVGGRLPGSLSTDLLLRFVVVVAVWVGVLWVAGFLLRRYAHATRMQTSERTTRLPVADVSVARLSGRTLSVRAPFDQSNRSGRWRLKVDSHDQGESLLALLGRR